MPSPIYLLGKLVRYLTGTRATASRPMEFRNRFIFPATPPRDEPYVDFQYLPRNLLDMILEDRDAVDGIGHIFVSSATYCKKKKGAQHEFLVFLVKDNTNPERHNTIIIDRFASSGRLDNRDTPPRNIDDLTDSDRRALQGDQSTSDSLFPPDSSSSQGVSTRGNIMSSGEGSIISNSPLPAIDMCRISVYGGFNGMAHRLGLDACSSLAELTFDDDSFTLEQLLIMAATVSAHKPHYALFKTQCYWYALMLWDLVQRITGKATTFDNNNGNVRQGANRLAPWLIRQPQGSERQAELEMLVSEYEKRWDTFCKELPRWQSQGVKAMQAIINRHTNAPVVQAPLEPVSG